jgi:hypothetical protein
MWTDISFCQFSLLYATVADSDTFLFANFPASPRLVLYTYDFTVLAWGVPEVFNESFYWCPFVARHLHVYDSALQEEENQSSCHRFREAEMIGRSFPLFSC